MADDRTRHVIDVGVDDRAARAALDRMERQIDRIRTKTGALGIGAGGAAGPTANKAGGAGGRGGNFGARSPVGGAMVGAVLGAGAGMLSGPSGMFGSAMGLAGGGLRAAGAAAAARGNNAMGGLLNSAGMAAAIGGGVGGAALSGLMQDVQTATGLERTLGIARHMGAFGVGNDMLLTRATLEARGLRGNASLSGVNLAGLVRSAQPFLGAAADAGIGPQAAQQALSAFMGAAGSTAAGSWAFSPSSDPRSAAAGGGSSTLINLLRRGYGPGAIGGFAQIFGAGFGTMESATGNRGAKLAESLVALAEDSGLRGSRVEGFLMEIAGHTKAMGMAGFNTAPAYFGSYVAGLSRAGGGRELPRATAAARNLAMAQVGARGQLLAPFKNLPQQALLARAAQGSSSPLEMLHNLEAMANQGPEATAQALAGIFQPGSEMWQLTGASQGMTSKMAARWGLGTSGELPTLGAAPGGIEMSAKQAWGELIRLGTVDKDQARELIDLTVEMRQIMNNIGGVAAEILDVLKKILF